MSASSSSSSQNARFLVAKHPTGVPAADTFRLESPAPLPTLSASGDSNKLLLKSLYISVDPYLRGRLNTAPLGEPMVSGLVAEVLDSHSDKFQKGDKVVTYAGWARYQVVDLSKEDPGMETRKITEDMPSLSPFLGILGMPGATAYFGLKEAAAFKKGDVVLVSGAAGAVGSTVGQLAKVWGAKRVIGSAGGPEKCKLVTEKFGFDACIDYKKFNTQEAVVAELKRLSPEGVDVYFDNTGGHVSDALYDVVRTHARVAVCGQISMYNSTEVPKVPSPFPKMIYTRVTVRGFLVFDYAARWGEFLGEMASLVREGRVKYEETVVDGFEKLPEALNGLFVGANMGKMVVKV